MNRIWIYDWDETIEHYEQIELEIVGDELVNPYDKLSK